MVLPEATLVKILLRFPLKSIARCRVVSKEWKSLLDSEFFRDLYISFNATSTVSWSIVQTKQHKLSLEIVGNYGCETWGLTRSPGSFMPLSGGPAIRKLLVLACTDGLVSIYAEASNGYPMYYVGNPLFEEWVQIPLPPFLSSQKIKRLQNLDRFSDTGLVTKIQSGIVVSYKVVWMLSHDEAKVVFMIYSSDTGVWEIRRNVTCPHSSFWYSQQASIALNGILHWFSFYSRSFLSYDFYRDHAAAADDGCRLIYFPDRGNKSRRFERTFTTSEGFIVYFNEYCKNNNLTLRVWRLVDYTDGPQAWQLFWEMSMMSLMDELGISYFPVVMHPLNSDIIYLWSSDNQSLVLLNLRTHVFTLHKETEGDSMCLDGCILSFNHCSEYMEKISSYSDQSFRSEPNNLLFSQYVLPRWLHRLPSSQPT